MKLRLRSIETKETVKIETPVPCSIQHLKQLLSQRIASASPSSAASIHISLNRKDELIGSSPEDTLQSLGLVSGDLLFFSQNPQSFSSQTLPLQINNTSPEPQQLQNSQERSLNCDTHKAVSLNLNTLKHPEASNSNTQSEEALNLDTQISMNTQNENTVDKDTQNKGVVDLDTQMGETAENMEVDDDRSVVDIGKSFSVPGFLRKVFIKELGDDDGSHHKLVVIAIHAVLLESGFVGYDPVTNMVFNGFYCPDNWPSSAFMMSLWYTLPEIVGHNCIRVDGSKTVVLKFQNVGKFFNVYGSLSTGSGTHWVRVNEEQLVPFLNLIWANCGGISETNEKDGVFSISPAKQVFAFWRTVKDRLALPLLIDLCEKAGLVLPPCFMRLPTDLKLQIFMRLPGVDVAKVGCVCSELRYLTSSDDLWKQKFVEQFGDAAQSEGGRHWKEKFAKSFGSRKTRRPGASSSFMRMRRNIHPFATPPIPLVPPIIVGDGDLLPPGVFHPQRQPNGIYFLQRNPLPHSNRGHLV